MGVDYTSGAFFGTFAIQDSVAHKELERRYAESDGEIKIDLVPGVSVARHGNSYSGDFCYAIKQSGSAFVSRGGGHSGPFEIQDARPEAIKDSIANLGLNVEDFEPIGFYLYLDVW